MDKKILSPEIVVFAGPNGSGKSTITELLKPSYDYVNADEIKKHIKCGDLEAAQIATSQRESYVEKMGNFSFETVMSTSRNLDLLKKAKSKGYFIKCFYVLTADPAINIARVKLRVSSGGHDVPKEKIVKRYHNALALIPELINVCDICSIYDNTHEPYRIFKKRKTEFFYDDGCEFWLDDDIKHLTGVTDCVTHKLNNQ